jgi:hypothetical protein
MFNEITESFNKRLLDYYGKNPLGETKYRVIWSPDRMEPQYGVMTAEYGHLAPQWIVEKWLSAEEYACMGPIEWDMTMRHPETNVLIGPYPRQGFYNFAFGCGEGVPLEWDVIFMICQCLERSKLFSVGERQAALQRKREQDEKAKDAFFSDSFDESMDSAAAGALVDRYTQPVSGPTNKFKRRDDVKITYTQDDIKPVVGGGTGTTQFIPQH